MMYDPLLDQQQQFERLAMLFYISIGSFSYNVNRQNFTIPTLRSYFINTQATKGKGSLVITKF